MNQNNDPDHIKDLIHSVPYMESQNRWYSSAIDFLGTSYAHPGERDSLKQLLKNTRRSLDHILHFRNAAFYLAEEQGGPCSLNYWEPVTRESLFRGHIGSLVRKISFDAKKDWDRTYVYSDDSSGANLVLQAIATPHNFLGVFAGMFDEELLPDISHEKLSGVSTVLNDLAHVLEGRSVRQRLFQFKDKANQTLSRNPQAQTSFPLNDPSAGWRESGASLRQPLHDFLTDLPIRPLVEDRLNMALAHARYSGEKVAVLILDVDNFKRINDFMGIPAGDTLLKSLAQRIRKSLREEDTLGRLGGDEFILLLPDIHLIQDIEFRVQKIFEGIRGSFQFEGKEIHASCSVGIAIYPDDGKDSAVLVKSAKAAMCKAKEQGKDRYQFFKPFMLAQGYQQMSLEGALRKAVEREEFILHFQPKMSIQTGKIQGMEALLRWNHPERGLIHPSEFIPAAEEMGLIQPIGDWVLLNACRQIKSWKRAGFPPICIAVNLSGYQVNQTHWIPRIREILSKTDVDPRYLEMEITETVLMDNSDVALSNLYKMDEMGIRISIDDFGTGYSSLSYLKRFPIHALKIDRSFIKGISGKEAGTDAVITKAIVSLARALNLQTVAEGVESFEEKEYLGAIGCDAIQGYLLSRPRPVEEINYMFTRKLKNPVRNYWPWDGKPQSANNKKAVEG